MILENKRLPVNASGGLLPVRSRYGRNTGFPSAYPVPKSTPFRDFGRNILDAFSYTPDPNKTFMERSFVPLAADMEAIISGFDAQGNKVPDSLRMMSLTMPGSTGLGGKAGVGILGAATGAVPKVGSASASRLMPTLENIPQEKMTSAVNIETSKRGDVVEINRIETPDNLRGQGLADQELEQFINKADKDGLTLAITPSDAFGANKARLTKWYKRHGFVPNKGRNKNFETRESMVRFPKPIEPASVEAVKVDAKKKLEKKLAIEKLRAEANAQRFGTDYRMAHQPLSPEDGAARLDDLTGKSVGTQMWPDDVYSPQGFNYYGGGVGDHGAATKESYNVILKAKNNPNSEITIYRAVPNDSNITTINEGDFVTLSKKYAELHGGSGYGLKGEDAGKVLSKKVKVKDIFSDGNDFNEFGYFPQSNSKGVMLGQTGAEGKIAAGLLQSQNEQEQMLDDAPPIKSSLFGTIYGGGYI